MSEQKILCDDCVHNSVCKHRSEYHEIVEAASKLSLYRNEEDGKVKSVPLKNIECFEGLTLHCKFFETRTKTTTVLNAAQQIPYWSEVTSCNGTEN